MKKLTFTLILLTVIANVGAAQTSDGEGRPSKKEAAERRAVDAAAEKFMKALDESLDISAVPKSLFVKDYDPAQPAMPIGFLETVGVDESTQPALREKRFNAAINLLNILVIWEVTRDDSILARNLTSAADAEGDEVEDESDERRFDPARDLPPDVVAALMESAAGRGMVGREQPGDDEIDTTDATQIDLSDRSFENAIRLLRISLQNRGEWLSKAAPILKRVRDNDARYGAEECSGEEQCLGLPEGTRVYYRTMFPLCLHFVRESGKMKVVAVHTAVRD